LFSSWAHAARTILANGGRKAVRLRVFGNVVIHRHLRHGLCLDGAPLGRAAALRGYFARPCRVEGDVLDADEMAQDVVKRSILRPAGGAEFGESDDALEESGKTDFLEQVGVTNDLLFDGYRNRCETFGFSLVAVNAVPDRDAFGVAPLVEPVGAGRRAALMVAGRIGIADEASPH
jgi:hypothetical protein